MSASSGISNVATMKATLIDLQRIKKTRSQAVEDGFKATQLRRRSTVVGGPELIPARMQSRQTCRTGQRNI
jgi:hypothetical protein